MINVGMGQQNIVQIRILQRHGRILVHVSSLFHAAVNGDIQSAGLQKMQ